MITVIITIICVGSMLQLSLLKAAIGALATSTSTPGAKASSRPRLTPLRRWSPMKGASVSSTKLPV
ncbi:hypothetical protein D9M72_633140 [compost metagenome]